jgi:hypothetical protein
MKVSSCGGCWSFEPRNAYMPPPHAVAVGSASSKWRHHYFGGASLGPNVSWGALSTTMSSFSAPT